MYSSENSLGSLTWALRAMQREVLQFSFQYPLDIDTAAGPKESLHYYLYSEKLSWSIMSMDPTGVPRARIRLAGAVYKPAYIAWWGLVNLGHHLRHHDAASLEAFLKQVDWLEAHATVRADGAVVWFNNHNCLQGKILLKAPWVSAYDQGLVISALVRGYRLTKRPHLLELVSRASRIFTVNVRDGGVREPLTSGALYCELPGQAIPGIQDGFMTSLLGLYDLFVETEDSAVKKLFDGGVAGLMAMLPAWDYRRRWSWYGCHAYLCPPSYHCLNRLLLEVLFRLTGHAVLAEYAEAWKADRLSALARAEIFLMFLLTKNGCRLRNRTWRFNQAKVRALASGKTEPWVPKQAAATSGPA
ncbi:MAG: D-glucuronyl C5-epimerase family protein [Terriglobales bacterium]